MFLAEENENLILHGITVGNIESTGFKNRLEVRTLIAGSFSRG
jgi:hypothetical protein